MSPHNASIVTAVPCGQVAKASSRLPAGKAVLEIPAPDVLAEIAADIFQRHQRVGNRLQCHVLEPDEIMTEIEVPLRPTRSTYLKFAPRKSWDFATASVAVSVMIERGICKDVRIVLGGIATHPYRSREAEALLKGNKIDDALATEAGEVAMQPARPLRMNHYKVDLSKTLIRRALQAITP